MRKRRNGFTRFMSKLDDKPGVSRKVDTSHFTIPYCLNISTVRKTLDDMESIGDVRQLSYCFRWSTSPQGFDYWDDIAVGRTVIDREGLDYLHWLLKQYT